MFLSPEAAIFIEQIWPYLAQPATSSQEAYSSGDTPLQEGTEAPPLEEGAEAQRFLPRF